MKFNKLVFAALACLFTVSRLSAQTQTRNIIIVFDGLRTDYITPEIMPNLYRFKQENSYGNASHSIFPCVTRVNASSYATGSYPQKHGILGNNIHLSMVDSIRVFDTGKSGNLMAIDSATGGHLLTAESIGEILRRNGQRMMVFSSGSSGQALLQNHTVNGGVINPDLIVPESLKQDVIKTIGSAPPYTHPDEDIRRHRWAMDAFFKYGLAADGPEVSAIWYSDPDETAHAFGVGSPATLKSLTGVDQQFQRLIDTLQARNLTDHFNIIITADHGFITFGGTNDASLSGFLIQQGLKRDKTSGDVVIADGAIFVKGHDPVIIQKIVESLQQQPWVGPIFTHAKSGRSDQEGVLKGTFSFDLIHWDHPTRSADILVSSPWDDRENAYHFKGTSERKGLAAGHGGLSPYEITIPLILSGPDFRKQYVSQLPTSNVDIVPTILALRHIAVPASMDGRVMEEFFTRNAGSGLPKVKKEIIRTRAVFDWGVYELEAHQTTLGDHRYFDFAMVKRSYKK